MENIELLRKIFEIPKITKRICVYLGNFNDITNLGLIDFNINNNIKKGQLNLINNICVSSHETNLVYADDYSHLATITFKTFYTPFKCKKKRKISEDKLSSKNTFLVARDKNDISRLNDVIKCRNESVENMLWNRMMKKHDTVTIFHFGKDFSNSSMMTILGPISYMTDPKVGRLNRISFHIDYSFVDDIQRSFKHIFPFIKTIKEIFIISQNTKSFGNTILSTINTFVLFLYFFKNIVVKIQLPYIHSWLDIFNTHYKRYEMANIKFKLEIINFYTEEDSKLSIPLNFISHLTILTGHTNPYINSLFKEKFTFPFLETFVWNYLYTVVVNDVSYSVAKNVKCISETLNEIVKSKKLTDFTLNIQFDPKNIYKPSKEEYSLFQLNVLKCVVTKLPSTIKSLQLGYFEDFKQEWIDLINENFPSLKSLILYKTNLNYKVTFSNFNKLEFLYVICNKKLEIPKQLKFLVIKCKYYKPKQMYKYNEEVNIKELKYDCGCCTFSSVFNFSKSFKMNEPGKKLTVFFKNPSHHMLFYKKLPDINELYTKALNFVDGAVKNASIWCVDDILTYI